MKKLMFGAVVVLALAAAGCGGGGGGSALTKEEYASKLNAICADTETKFAAAGVTDMASFKTKGDEVVSIAEDAVEQFNDLKAPDELDAASTTFNNSSDEIVEDLKKATEKAKEDDQAGFEAAGASLQNHGNVNDEAAREIGADDCVSGT